MECSGKKRNVSGVSAETLTAPCRYVLLLLQCLLYRAALPRYLDLQPLEEALIGPVRVAPAPVTLLGPLPLGTAPPFVVGAVALPAEAGMGSVVESGHLEGHPRAQSQGHVRRRACRPCDHACVSIAEGLVQTQIGRASCRER